MEQEKMQALLGILKYMSRFICLGGLGFVFWEFFFCFGLLVWFVLENKSVIHGWQNICHLPGCTSLKLDKFQVKQISG